MRKDDNKVMNGLISIREELSSASKKRGSWSDPDDPANPVPRVETVNVPNSETRVTGMTILDNAIGRRCDDLFKSRRDLAGRIAESLASIRTEKKLLIRRMDEADAAEKKLTEIESALMPDVENEKLPSTQSELSDACRKVERLRMETISATTEFNALRQSSAADSGALCEPSIDIDSLTFGQIFRISIIFAMPIGICLLICAVIIAAAYIIAIRGGF